MKTKKADFRVFYSKIRINGAVDKNLPKLRKRSPLGRVSKRRLPSYKNRIAVRGRFSREPACNYAVRATIERTAKKGIPRLGFPFLWCGRQELNTFAQR